MQRTYVLHMVVSNKWSVRALLCTAQALQFLVASIDPFRKGGGIMSASQLFERVPIREGESNLSNRQYGSTQSAAPERGPANKTIRNSIGGGDTDNVAFQKQAGPPEVRRFSSSAVSANPLARVAAEDAPRGREDRSLSVDEFNGEDLPPGAKLSNITKALRTGRQRKKTAARSKGGEFQARRKKRRVYFCCISNDIDVEKLVDEFQVAHAAGFSGRLYDEVLHLTIVKDDGSHGDAKGIAVPEEGADIARLDSGHSMIVADAISAPSMGNTFFAMREPAQLNQNTVQPSFEVNYSEGTLLNDFDGERSPRSPSHEVRYGRGGEPLTFQPSFEEDGYPSANEGEISPFGGRDHEVGVHNPLHGLEGVLGGRQYTAETEHSKEVFVFGFGAAVFWGLAKSEVQELLHRISQFIVKDRLSTEEFEAGEDDMAFVTDYDCQSVHIANDVITLPPYTSVKERLALSFAIAQSAVLTIFEARVEKKIEEYKYIPLALAASGKVDLSPKALGTMIGEVFVMQHDVNLHSEILDLPDYFWKEHHVEPLYRMTMGYMEMEPRIAVLNKRLDLMRELLRVLQQQHENAHSVKLEWIVIWLIVISCVLEMWDIVKDVFGIDMHRDVNISSGAT